MRILRKKVVYLSLIFVLWLCAFAKNKGKQKKIKGKKRGYKKKGRKKERKKRAKKKRKEEPKV